MNFIIKIYNTKKTTKEIMRIIQRIKELDDLEEISGGIGEHEREITFVETREKTMIECNR